MIKATKLYFENVDSADKRGQQKCEHFTCCTEASKTPWGEWRWVGGKQCSHSLRSIRKQTPRHFKSWPALTHIIRSGHLAGRFTAENSTQSSHLVIKRRWKSLHVPWSGSRGSFSLVFSDGNLINTDCFIPAFSLLFPFFSEGLEWSIQCATRSLSQQSAGEGRPGCTQSRGWSLMFRVDAFSWSAHLLDHFIAFHFITSNLICKNIWWLWWLMWPFSSLGNKLTLMQGVGNEWETWAVSEPTIILFFWRHLIFWALASLVD